jgi:hypothetical protein
LNRAWFRVLAGWTLAAGLTAAAAAPAAGQRLIPGKDPAHPLVKYADSLVSLNDRCIVRQGGLNPAFKPVYVNGRPIGFC